MELELLQSLVIQAFFPFSLPSRLGLPVYQSHHPSCSPEPLYSPLLTCPASLTLSLCLLLPAGQLYGLEKFWAFLKYSKAKNLDIDPKLQEYLGKFRRLEDFRVDVSESLSSFSSLSLKENWTRDQDSRVLVPAVPLA